MKKLLFHSLAFFLSYLICMTGHAAERVLTYSVQVVPASKGFLDPIFANDYILMRNITEGLFTTDVKGEVVLGQIENYKVSADGLRYEFDLRSDTFWSDGREVVAQDYVRAWRRVVDPKHNNSAKIHLSVLKNYGRVVSGELPLQSIGISSVGKKVLVVELDSPLSFFTKLLTLPQLAPLPSHLSDGDLESMLEGKGEYISNGPFQLELMSNAKVIIRKNGSYWGRDQVFFDAIEFLSSESVRGMVIDVVSGEADLALLLDHAERKWVKKRYPKYLQRVSRYGTEYYNLNLEHDVLGNSPELRQAMSMSIDRDKIVQDIMKLGVPAYNLVPSGLYQKKRQTLPGWIKMDYLRRIKHAKEIVDKHKAGSQSPIKVSLKIKDAPHTIKVASAVKVMWERIGLSVDIEELGLRKIYQDIHQGDYEVARAGWMADYNDPYNFLYLYGKDQERMFGPGSLDSTNILLDKALSEMDDGKREDLYVDIEDTNHEYNTIIPLYHFEHVYVRNPKLHGIEAARNTSLLKWAYFGETISNRVEAQP